jgi:hypothetical protein
MLDSRSITEKSIRHEDLDINNRIMLSSEILLAPDGAKAAICSPKLGLGPNWPPARRAYALEGMVECWNIGILGLGILSYWLNGNIRLDLNVRTDKILQKPIIPPFHYSIVPRPGAGMHASKNTP